MRIFLAFVFCASSWAQENPSELKLPENFLRFDISKLRQSVAITSKPQSNVIAMPKQVACGHIRVVPTNPDLDPGIALASRNYIDSHMPVLKGMPSCQTAVR